MSVALGKPRAGMRAGGARVTMVRWIQWFASGWSRGGYVGLALAVAPTAPWILSVLYMRTERGRAARDVRFVKRREEFLTRWSDRSEQSHDRDRDQSH